jgi:hypothetical protein
MSSPGVCHGSRLVILVDGRPTADCRFAIFVLAGRILMAEVRWLDYRDDMYPLAKSDLVNTFGER